MEYQRELSEGLGFLVVSLCRFHIAHDVEAHQLVACVGTDGDQLLELTSRFAFSVINHLDFSIFSRSNRCLSVSGNGATARSNGLFDDERFVTRVLKFENIGLFLLFIEFTKVMFRGLEGDDSLSSYGGNA